MIIQISRTGFCNVINTALLKNNENNIGTDQSKNSGSLIDRRNPGEIGKKVDPNQRHEVSREGYHPSNPRSHRHGWYTYH